MTVKNAISARDDLLTEVEGWFTKGARAKAILPVVCSMFFGFMAVGFALIGLWYFLIENRWLLPWHSIELHPNLILSWIPVALYLTYLCGYKPTRSAHKKLKKLRNNTATQADIDAWTMEVTGQIFRTATNQMPELQNDLTVEAIMAGATFPPPRQ